MYGLAVELLGADDVPVAMAAAQTLHNLIEESNFDGGDSDVDSELWAHDHGVRTQKSIVQAKLSIVAFPLDLYFDFPALRRGIVSGGLAGFCCAGRKRTHQRVRSAFLCELL